MGYLLALIGHCVAPLDMRRDGHLIFWDSEGAHAVAKDLLTALLNQPFTQECVPDLRGHARGKVSTADVIKDAAL
jgi:hypothetical protein